MKFAAILAAIAVIATAVTAAPAPGLERRFKFAGGGFRVGANGMQDKTDSSNTSNTNEQDADVQSIIRNKRDLPPEPKGRINSISLDKESDPSIRESIESLDDFFKDFYNGYVRKVTPVVRGTPEVRYGRKYIGSVALPKYLENAMEDFIKGK
ncbi:hypothetical protein H4219_002040 [Mycoemilia scoparia]|uniref:RxLR effector protein n=1 Tax=Mycoemilia scoparia TaxID=417184 RepID=A0A9W8DUL6_9FUNG|nr:hypothetical protein H4219_002040 [Mycoemilia scoparia]